MNILFKPFRQWQFWVSIILIFCVDQLQDVKPLPFLLIVLVGVFTAEGLRSEDAVIKQDQNRQESNNKAES